MGREGIIWVQKGLLKIGSTEVSKQPFGITMASPESSVSPLKGCGLRCRDVCASLSVPERNRKEQCLPQR